MSSGDLHVRPERRPMDVLDAIWTTRAMRHLDPARPVDEEDIWTVVEAATKAMSHGNSQPVRWIVVTDERRRRQLGEIYARMWIPLREGYRRSDDEGRHRNFLASLHLADHLGESPVILAPCTAHDVDGSSVYPAIQNLLLAARALGLGTAYTDRHRGDEAAVRAVLGIPDDVQTWALIAMGHPLGRWGEARRRPVEEVTYWDGWGNTRARG